MSRIPTLLADFKNLRRRWRVSRKFTSFCIAQNLDKGSIFMFIPNGEFMDLVHLGGEQAQRAVSVRDFNEFHRFRYLDRARTTQAAAKGSEKYEVVLIRSKSPVSLSSLTKLVPAKFWGLQSSVDPTGWER